MKSKANLIIDAIMLLVLMAIAGMGFLMKYILVPGYQRAGLYDADTELIFLGLTRHRWGSIHLILSLLLLGLLVIHIILHWEMIVCIFSRMVHGKAVRTGMTVFMGSVCLFLGLGPFLVKPELVALNRPHQHSQRTEVSGLSEVSDTCHTPWNSRASQPDVKVQAEHSHDCSGREHPYDSVEIHGYMTLQEVAGVFEIPVAALAEAVDIPLSQTDVKLGRLKKTKNFNIGDIKRAALALQHGTE